MFLNPHRFVSATMFLQNIIPAGLAAWISYRFIESPILWLKERGAPSQAIPIAAPVPTDNDDSSHRIIDTELASSSEMHAEGEASLSWLRPAIGPTAINSQTVQVICNQAHELLLPIPCGSKCVEFAVCKGFRDVLRDFETRNLQQVYRFKAART